MEKRFEFLNRHKNSEGQVSLLAVTLILILGIGVFTAIYVTSVGSRHSSSASQNAAGQLMARDGITYAAQVLGGNGGTVWWQAVQGQFPSPCNSGHPITTPAGEQFNIYCSTGLAGNLGIQSYQVAVTAVALQAGTGRPLKAVKAYLAPRTVGLDTVNNKHVPVAMMIAGTGLQYSNMADNGLNLHWGPIAFYQPGDLAPTGASDQGEKLFDPINHGLYPRKFATNKLSGGGFTSPPRNHVDASFPMMYSDEKEYWYDAPMGFPPVIDADYYKQQAMTVTSGLVNFPTSELNGGNPIPPSNCPPSAGGPSCGYFDVPPGDTALFTDNAGTGYQLPAGQTVLFINGNAEFKRTDFYNVSVVVTGTLTVSQSSGGEVRNLHVPSTAPLEYPYYPATPASWPCSDLIPDQDSNGTPLYDCPSTTAGLFSGAGNVSFHGFLYTQQGFVCTAPAPGWNMAGVLMVGNMSALGPIQFAASVGRCSFAYDDIVNHHIHTKPFNSSNTIAIVPEWIQAVSPK